MQSTTQIEDIDIPRDIFTWCPLNPGELSPVAACITCEHFAGLECRSDNEELAFEARYRVRCRHPNTLDLCRVRLDMLAREPMGSEQT